MLCKFRNISYSQNNNDDEIFNKIDNKDLSFDDISLKRSPSVEPEPPITELKPVIKNIPKFEKSEYLYKTPVETAPIIDKQEKNLNLWLFSFFSQKRIIKILTTPHRLSI